MPNFRTRAIAAMLGAALLAQAAPLLAGSSITPTAVQLRSAREIGQVTLFNGGTTPMLVQGRALLWTQADGHDVHAETTDLIVAPAIIEVAPGHGQVFRVRLRGSMPAAEHAYRLQLEDITPVEPGQGVGVRVRHDLPVVASPAGVRPDLVLSSCAAPAGSGCLRVTNRGTGMAKVMSIGLTGASWTSSLSVPATVLAGEWHEWRYPAKQGAASSATLTTSAGPVTASLTPSG